MITFLFSTCVSGLLSQCVTKCVLTECVESPWVKFSSCL
jgi:hypothetical protein